jgi:hypothetical protein
MNSLVSAHLYLRCRCCTSDAEKALPTLTTSGRKLARDIHSVLRDMGDAVSPIVISHPNQAAQTIAEIESVLSDPVWVDRVVDATKPTIERIIADGGKRGGRMVGVSFNAADDSVQRVVDSSVTRLAEDIQNGTTTEVSKLLGRRMEEGAPTSVIVRDLRKQQFSPERARAIARTESARASNNGQIESWRQSPILIRKSWKASVGACQFCDRMEMLYGPSNPIDIDKPFLSVGESLIGTEGGSMTNTYAPVMGAPLHPNCTCTISPQWNRTEERDE